MKFRRIISVFLLAVLMTVLLVPSAAALEPIEVNAKAALLVDAETGTVLYSKNETKKMYPASITKVVTALLVLEAVERGELSMDQLITASEEAFFDMEWDGSNAGIEPGEEMRLKDLLYCILLVSANEACNIVADEQPRSGTRLSKYPLHQHPRTAQRRSLYHRLGHLPHRPGGHPE